MKIFEIVGKIAVDNKNAKEKIKETTEDSKSGSEVMQNSFKKLAGVIATTFTVSKIVEFGKKIVDTSASIQASVSQFNQTFTTGGEDLRSTAKSILDDIGSQSGVLATRLQDSGTKIYAFAKSSGASSSEAMELMKNALMASADASAYYDRSLEDTTQTMMSFLKGNYENDAALGVSATEFTRNAKATEMFGVKFNELTEIQKQQTLLQMVLDSQKLSGAMGQASREADGWENVQGNLNESWRQFLGVIGAPVLNAVIPVIQSLSGKIQEATDFVKNLKQHLEENRDTIETMIISVGTLTTAMVAFKVGAVMTSVIQGFQQAQLALALFTAQQGSANIAQAVFNGTLTLGETLVALLTGKVTLAQLASQGWTTAQTALNAVLSANPIGVVIALITSLIGVLVLAYNKFEWFRDMVDGAFSVIKNVVGGAVDFIKTNIVDKIGSAISYANDKFNHFKTTTTNAWNTIKNAITKPIEDAKNAVKNGIDKMKSFFNFNWSLPKLKLPHVSIRGEFSLMPPKVPTFGIDWYAKGGILNEPTAFGISPNGNLRVGGEAGAEAVAPIDVLLGYVRTAVNESNSGIAEGIQNLIMLLTDYLPQMANMQLVLDSGVLVGEVAPQVDEELGNIQRRKGRN